MLAINIQFCGHSSNFHSIVIFDFSRHKLDIECYFSNCVLINFLLFHVKHHFGTQIAYSNYISL